MPDFLSTWGADTALDLLLPAGCHLACHTDDPTTAGLGSTEVVGGGYRRQPVAFSSAANRARVSTNPQVFTGMPESVVTYLAAWTALSGGKLIVAKQLAEPITVQASGQVIVPAGDFTVLF